MNATLNVHADTDPDGTPAVLVGSNQVGYFVLDAEQSREMARRLLVAADTIEDKTPAHVYQVDNR